MAASRAGLALLAAVAVAAIALSGGSRADPRTPAALPGMPAPFLGTALVGGGGLTAAIDAYGDVVDLRAPGPAGAALIEAPSDRQLAGSVSAETGIVPRVRIGGAPALPLWKAESVAQRYLPGTSVVRTIAELASGDWPGAVEVKIADAARGGELARLVRVKGPSGGQLAPVLSLFFDRQGGVRCEQERRGRELALLCSEGTSGKWIGGNRRHRGAVLAQTRQVIAATAAGDRRWLAQARPLAAGAPSWAVRMYRRSLLVLRTLTDRRTGAAVAGARDGWAYVWPRDASVAAMALAVSGYRPEARRIARFLLGLDLGAGARFGGDGAPIPGRAAQGDAAGWVAAAAGAVGFGGGASASGSGRPAWRNLPDYQEGDTGDYLANAIAAPSTIAGGAQKQLRKDFETHRGLVRRAGDPGAGLDSAAAWAVRPFPRPALLPAVRETLLSLARHQTRFGITPSEEWPGADPWTAPTAWTAWSLAALGERRGALRLLADLRRASTPAGDLPERVDARAGVPRSTTPLAWSHAFAILALRELSASGAF